MKYIKLYEEFIANKIECDNCGWTWKLEDGGNDLYICHKCGHDNTSILGEVQRRNGLLSYLSMALLLGSAAMFVRFLNIKKLSLIIHYGKMKNT